MPPNPGSLPSEENTWPNSRIHTMGCTSENAAPHAWRRTLISQRPVIWAV
jgi:hypothetical protein